MPYGRLLWEFGCVDACPVHDLNLVTRCPRCRSSFGAFVWRGRPGFCPYCRIPVSPLRRYKGAKVDILQDAEKRLARARSVGELITFLASRTPSKDRWGHVIDTCVRLAGGIRPLSRASGHVRQRLEQWILRRGMPSFKSVLQLADTLRLRPAERLFAELRDIEPAMAARLSKISSNESYGSRHLSKNRIVGTSRLERARQALQNALSDESPISLTRLAAGLGHSRYTLRRLFPELCTMVAARYMIDQKRRGAQRRAAICARVEAAAQALRAEGRNVTVKGIQVRLGTSIVLLHPEVRETLQRVLSEYNQTAGDSHS